MTPAETIDRATRAKQLLDDPLLREAFAEIERLAFEEFLASGHDADALRRACQDRITAIRNVRQHLSSLVTSGRQAVLHRDRE